MNIGDRLRGAWRQIKESVLQGRGTPMQKIFYRLLAGFITRYKGVVAVTDLRALAIWLMYHPECGVLPCEGWRLKNPPKISAAETAELAERLAADRKAVAQRLSVEEIDLGAVEPSRKARRIAVHVHAFYPDVMPRIETALKNIPLPFDLYVSGPEINRGRDIAPMICKFGKALADYDFIAHFHTKKSPHLRGETDWLGHVLSFLLGSPESVARIFGLLESGYGMVSAPDYLVTDEDPTGWARNLPHAERLLRMAGMQLDLGKDFTPILFPQGSMFWARGDFLRRFLELPLTFEDFPEEPIGVDGSPAHALERMFFLWGQGSGLRVARLRGTEAGYD